MNAAKEALRALTEKVEPVPVSVEESERGKPRDCSTPGLAIHLHGAPASLLRLACGLRRKKRAANIRPRGYGYGYGATDRRAPWTH